jgi:prophage regulatory protein
MDHLDQLPQAGFIRLPAVLKFIPVSKSSWWEGVRIGLYPQPVKIGKRTTAWRVQDIQQLMTAISEGKRGL